MPDVRTPPTPDARDALIKRQHEEIARLRDALTRAEHERDRVKRRNERLGDQLDAARRAGFRQAAPFAKPHRQGTGRPPGRRGGAAYGLATASAPCPGVSMRPTMRLCRWRVPHVAARYTARTSSRSIRKICRWSVPSSASFASTWARVRRVAAASKAAIRCRPRTRSGRRRCRSAPRPWRSSSSCTIGFGLPLAHVVTLLRERFGIRVTRGALVQVCARMATRATPTYEALCAQVRGSPVVSPDETGWKVAGTLHWLWAFTTADPTVYAIRPGR